MSTVTPEGIDALAPGTKVTVTYEGIVTDLYKNGRTRRAVKVGDAPSAETFDTYLGAHHLHAAKAIATVDPTWKPGDVITLRFSPGGKAYTYVRGAVEFLGDDPLSDAEINRSFHAGRVVHVMRDGKVLADSGVSLASGGVVRGPVARSFRPGDRVSYIGRATGTTRHGKVVGYDGGLVRIRGDFATGLVSRHAHEVTAVTGPAPF